MQLKLLNSQKIERNGVSRRTFITSILSVVLLPIVNGVNANSKTTCGGVNSSYKKVIEYPRKGTIETYVNVELINLKLDKEEFYSGELTSGKILVRNNKPIKKTGNLKLSLVDEWDVESSSVEYSDVNIPAYTQSEFYFSGGPSLYVTTDRNVSFKAKSNINSVLDDTIVIRA